MRKLYLVYLHYQLYQDKLLIGVFSCKENAMTCEMPEQFKKHNEENDRLRAEGKLSDPNFYTLIAEVETDLIMIGVS